MLKADDDLVYNIAWDIPSKILPYFATSFDFENGALRDAACAPTIMSIFMVLTEKGNRKELFIKSIECLDLLQVEPTPSGDKELSNRYFELKFVATYELLFATLQRVEAQYPSRFLATATSALLSFMVKQLDTISMRTLCFLLRRFFLFTRDYNPISSDPDKNVPATEAPLQRKLLQRFLTDVIAIGLQKFPVRWARRLVTEFKKGVAFNPDPEIRYKAFYMDYDNSGFYDIIFRLTELAMSLDLELDVMLEQLIDDSVQEFEDSSKSDTESESSTIIPPSYDNPSYDFSNIKTPESISLSNEGILLLTTSARFEDRTNPKTLRMSFSELIKVTKRFVMGSEEDSSGLVSAGLQDALCFWALWVSRKVSAEEVQNSVDKKTFISYLHMLMYIFATSADAELKQLVYSITSRLLVLHTPEVRYEYMVDTVEFCPFPSVCEATVGLLKDFMIPLRKEPESTKKETAPVKTESPAEKQATPKGNANDIDAVASSVANLSLNNSQTAPVARLSLTLEQEQKLQSLILDQANAIEILEEGILGEEFPILLAWLKFLGSVKSIATPELTRGVRTICANILAKELSKESSSSNELLQTRKEQLQTGLSLL